MTFSLEEEIIKKTQYKSGYEPKGNEYVISASMVGNELLQNYLSIVFGPQPSTEIRDTTLGTIFHLGMESLFKGNTHNGIKTEHAMHTKLENGWILSGTADLIVETEPNVFEIHDFKLAKTYTMKMLKKEINTHNYAMQLRALRNILYFNLKKENKTTNNIDIYCDFFLKDSKMIENEKVFHSIKIPRVDVASAGTTIDNIVDYTNELQQYIEEGKVPPKCKDTWIRKINGRTVHMKCQYYCAQAKNCPYYDTMGTTTMIDFANWSPNE